MVRLWLLGIWMMAGCVTTENFANKASALYCERLYECNKSAFESAYSDIADCIIEVTDASETVSTCFQEECTFDPKAARSCLHTTGTATCDEWGAEPLGFGPDCDEVYYDCDEADYIICLLQ